jgi:phage protein D
MAEKVIQIHRGQDFYVPHFQIKVGKRPLSREVVHDILSVTYSDSLDQVDRFEFTVNNWDEENPTFEKVRKRTFKYSDEDTFMPGQEVELWMGYYGQDRLRLMIVGRITALRPTFPASGASTLGVSGLNTLHELRTNQRSGSYKKMTDSQIAGQIANRLGLDFEAGKSAADEPQHEFVFQDNQYDIIFLVERARRLGYELFVQESGENGRSKKSTLYFGPSEGIKREVYELAYGATLLQFTPNLNTANQTSGVTVRSWDRRNKEKIEYTARRSGIQTKGVGTRGGQGALDRSFSERHETITDRPVESQDEAQAYATRTMENISKEMLKGSGSTIGLPDLRAGSVVQLTGLGERFSGRYFVTSTTHTIDDSGYTTQFECRREELSRRA